MISTEADSAELQEAVSKSTFSQQVDNLEAATTYCVFLKAYSALGASQQSRTVMATTKGGGALASLHAVHLEAVHHVTSPCTACPHSPHCSQLLHKGPEPDGHAGVLGAAQQARDLGGLQTGVPRGFQSSAPRAGDVSGPHQHPHHLRTGSVWTRWRPTVSVTLTCSRLLA